MNDGDDILASFESVFAENSKPKGSGTRREGSYPYPTFDMCNKYNRGQVIGVIIPPKSGKIIRNLTNVFRGRIPNPTDPDGYKFNLRWCGNENYFNGNVANISDEDLAFNAKVGEEIERYINNFGDSVFIKQDFKLSIFYMAIVKAVPVEADPSEYPNPAVTIMLNKAKSFVGDFESALKQKIEDEGSHSWLKNWFPRATGPVPYFTRITTTHDVGPYKINVEFVQLNKLTVTLDDSHMTSIKDLNTEFIDTTKYDREYYEELYKIIKSENDKAGNTEGIVEIPDNNQPKIEEVQTVPAPQTPKVNNPVLEDI